MDVPVPGVAEHHHRDVALRGDCLDGHQVIAEPGDRDRAVLDDLEGPPGRAEGGQAGTGGMNVADAHNRGAFMLGGSGTDNLTGGIQADLLTFAAHGLHGTTAITAITAQNTVTVTSWQALPAAMVRASFARSSALDRVRL